MVACCGRMDADPAQYLELRGARMSLNTVARKPSVFSLKDFLYSFLLVELFKGLALTGRYAFRRKVTLQYPEEKRHCHRGLEGCMRCGAMKTARSGALRASCARRFARQWRLRSNQRSVMMGHVEPPGMTSI